MKRISLFIAFFIFGIVSIAQTRADDILGYWLTTGKELAKIQIYENNKKYYGKIVWLENPSENGKLKVDVNNPDESKKNHTIIDLVLLTNFKYNGESEWNGGRIYDPASGNTYRSYLSLKDKNTLQVRGYVGISLFGRTEIWKRVN